MDGDNLMDLDLNQEPVNPTLGSIFGYNSLLSELQTTHGSIEDRIRLLELVTARVREHQTRNPVEISNLPGELVVNLDGRGSTAVENSSVNVVERNVEREKSCKRDSSQLVAKALAMDGEVKKVDKDGGSFFACNVCLDVAKDPVLTCCGHLFCWACFYLVSYIDSTSKECPVCLGEVSDSSVIPIYGNGGRDRVAKLDSGLEVPPRPKARRVESVRQRRIPNGMSHVPVLEALRRIRTSIGATGDRLRLDGVGNVNLSSGSGSQEVQNAEVTASRGLRPREVSRVASESAAAFSTLSTALSTAERLVEDLETVINRRVSRSDARLLSVDNEYPFTRDTAVTLSDNQHPDSAAGVSSALPNSSSSAASDLPDVVVNNSLSGVAADINLPMLRSSSRRRNVSSRIPDAESSNARGYRRRRSS